jgi:predicted RNA methylase
MSKRKMLEIHSCEDTLEHSLYVFLLKINTPQSVVRVAHIKSIIDFVKQAVKDCGGQCLFFFNYSIASRDKTSHFHA